ncbi:Glutamate receptor ionotropic kainate 4, partial [Bienertia sinuspersici]
QRVKQRNKPQFTATRSEGGKLEESPLATVRVSRCPQCRRTQAADARPDPGCCSREWRIVVEFMVELKRQASRRRNRNRCL